MLTIHPQCKQVADPEKKKTEMEWDRGKEKDVVWGLGYRARENAAKKGGRKRETWGRREGTGESAGKGKSGEVMIRGDGIVSEGAQVQTVGKVHLGTGRE